MKKENICQADRIAAVPLITCDPYFSLWSGSDCLYETDTMHWTGVIKRMRGVAEVDGKTFRFAGLGTEETLRQTKMQVNSTNTCYHFEGAGISLQVKFWTPLLLDDPEVLSRPCSYVDMKVTALDGKEHQVQIRWSFDEEFCYDGEESKAIGGGCYFCENRQLAWMGQRRQMPLGHSGDGVTIDWGYLYLAVEGKDAEKATVIYRQQNAEAQEERACLSAIFKLKAEPEKESRATLVAAYDDVAAIFYFGRMMPGYWARNGKTIVTAIGEAFEQKEELSRRCREFDQLLQKDTESFGAAYAQICSAAYRQSIAAHKLIADEEGRLIFLSKECFSNGCIGTVDVTYPSTPLYFCYQPELVRAMLRPVLRFARMPVWNFDFAPHDVGRYPYVSGQVYGLEKEQRAYAEMSLEQEQGQVFPMFYQMPGEAAPYGLKDQMPVEESGNMLILAAALVKLEPEKGRDVTLESMDLYEKWVKYLLEYGSDPGEQLCTDDFAGHLAHNVNLAVKAIMGVESYGILLRAAGREEEADRFHQKAVQMAGDVYERSKAQDHTKLTFDGPDESWSLKYNAVWDLLFGSGLWPECFYEQELSYYEGRQNDYGVPLDSRNTYTKSDWIMWCAAMWDQPEKVELFAERILRFLKESPDRVPFSDWYDTVSSKQIGFQNRTVQGGLFMPLLHKKQLL